MIDMIKIDVNRINISKCDLKNELLFKSFYIRLYDKKNLWSELLDLQI